MKTSKGRRTGTKFYSQVFTSPEFQRPNRPTFAWIAKDTGDSTATIWRIAHDVSRPDPMPCFASFGPRKPGVFAAPYDKLYDWMARRKKWKSDQNARLKQEKVDAKAKALIPKSRSAEYWSAKRGRRMTVEEVRAVEMERQERHGPGAVAFEFKNAVAAMNRTAPSLGGPRRPRTPEQWPEVMCWIWAHDLKPMVDLYYQILSRAKKGSKLVGQPL